MDRNSKKQIENMVLTFITCIISIHHNLNINISVGNSHTEKVHFEQIQNLTILERGDNFQLLATPNI